MNGSKPDSERGEAAAGREVCSFMRRSLCAGRDIRRGRGDALAASPRAAAIPALRGPTPRLEGTQREGLKPTPFVVEYAVLARPMSLVPTPPPAAKPARGVSLRMAALLLAVGGLAVSAGLAFGLALVPGLERPWVAAMAAALGFLAAALPLAWMFGKLAHKMLHPAEPPLPAVGLGAGLPRPIFMDMAEREWARARRYGSGAALLLLEIDRPARLAEVHGPAAVDDLLQTLLRATAPTLRPADFITRFSDTRLAVFLAQADPTGAIDVAERLRDRVEKLEMPPSHGPISAVALRATASLGVAHMRPAHVGLHALIDEAEDALAASSLAGGNCVRAAPLEASRLRGGAWRGDDRRARPKQGGTT